MSFPVTVGVTPSVLGHWTKWERVAWEERGRPDRHAYSILTRHTSRIRLEDKEEALLIYHSALNHARWWERDDVFPETAAALRDRARRVVEEAGLSAEEEVIERWIEEVRRLSDCLMQPAVAWRSSSSGDPRFPVSVGDLVVEQGITLEAEIAKDQSGAEALQRHPSMQDNRMWDVRLTHTRRYQSSFPSSEEPAVEAVLTAMVRIAQQVVLAGEFRTWWLAFWSDLPETTAKMSYEEARNETRRLRELLGEELFLDVVPRIHIPRRQLSR